MRDHRYGVSLAALLLALTCGSAIGAAEWRPPGAELFAAIGVPWCAGEAFVTPALGLQNPQGGGDANTVTEIVVNGLANITSDTVRLAMVLKPGEAYSDTQMRADASTLENLGVFENVYIHAEPLPTGVRVVVDVIEHPVITTIQFSGDAHVVKEEELRELMALEPGRVLNTNTLRTDVGNIKNYLGQKGYFAEVTSAEFLPDQEGVLDIRVVVMRVAAIELEGLIQTKPYVVRREMRTQVGDFFNMETWRKDLLRIYNLGYFENVVPMPPLAPEYDTVALGLTLTERRTGSVNLGISYGERQRLAGFVRLEEQNLFGTGQSAFINTSRANISDGFSIEIGYTNPWIDRHHTGLSVNLYDKLVFRFSSTFFGGVSDPEDTERYDERRRGGSVTLSRPFSEYLTGFSTVRLEAVQTNNVATMEGDSFIQQDGDIMSLSTGLIDNARDLDVDPASGHYYKANIETGIANVTQVGGVFSDSDIIGRNPFTKFAVDGRWYYSPEGRREKPDDLKHVWALRVFAGTLAGNIPFFEQYFVGGADTIRGHPEDRFWGKHAAFTNLEYRIPLQKAMTLVTFVDYGDAWGGYETVNTFTQSTNFQGQLGYGIGLHFRTPLGPIRLDFAINQDGKSRTHFMIGHTF